MPPVKREYQGSCSGVISASCVRRWEKEVGREIMTIDRGETRPAKCLMFMLNTKAGVCDSVVTHELSASECTPSAIWPIVRDVMYAAGGRSATSDTDLRALCNGQKTTVRLPVSSTGYTMHISMLPTLRCTSRAEGMVVWAFSGQSGQAKLFLAPADAQYNRVLSAFFGKLSGSGPRTQVEYSILLDAPPIMLGTATCVGAEAYTFARSGDISAASVLG